MKNELCIGILGGVGPQATQYVYEKICALAQSEYGVSENDAFPRILILSEPVTDFISSKERLPEARRQVLRALDRLLQANITHLAIASNTVHLLADDIEALCKKQGVVFVSMISAVADYCARKGYKTVGILGSPVTLHSQLYDNALNTKGIDLKKPSESDYFQLGCIIKRVIAGKVTPADATVFKKMYSECAQKSDAVLLGCTELPVLHTQLQIGTYAIDSSSILAKALLKHYYSTEKSQNTKEHTS